jgi:hypothetical protein
MLCSIEFDVQIIIYCELKEMWRKLVQILFMMCPFSVSICLYDCANGIERAEANSF